MTALTQNRKTDQLGTPEVVIPSLLFFGVEANTTIYGGAMVAINTAGYAVPASSNAALKPVGRCLREVQNTTAAGFGAQGALNVTVEQGYFFYNCPDSSITIANFGSYCFAVDDNNVSMSDASGTRPVAGVVIAVGEYGLYPTGVGQICVYVGGATPFGVANTVPSSAYRARAVVTTLSGTYTGSTTNTLTASAASAFGTQDGVSTLAVGDIVLLPAGTTHITTASDAGPWQISVLGTGLIKWVLTRPDWWPTAGVIPNGATIDLAGGGTLFGGTSWKSFAAQGTVIDTTDPALYPRQVTQEITLLTAGGNVAVTNVPIFSATRSNVLVSYAGSGTPNAATLGYQPGAITPGAINTATVTVQAVKAAMAAQATDTSVLNCTIVNG